MGGAWEVCPAGGSRQLHKGQLSHRTLSSSLIGVG